MSSTVNIDLLEHAANIAIEFSEKCKAKVAQAKDENRDVDDHEVDLMVLEYDSARAGLMALIAASL